jgi:signal transduction histidine kinase/ligand-binding sensor domain-containing protein
LKFATCLLHIVSSAFRSRLCTASLFILVSQVPFVHAEEWTPLTQYQHRAWRTSDGWFDNAPLSIAQGGDGYLWIGTQMGLLRFDGIRFSKWRAPGGHGALNHAKLLLQSREGALWIVSDKGLSVLRGNELTDIPLSGGSIQSLFEDHGGTIWSTRAMLKDGQMPLCTVSTHPVRCYGPADGLSILYATKMAEDREGFLWIGSSSLVRWKPGTPQTDYFTQSLQAYGDSNGVSDLLTLSDGSLLAGLAAKGADAGLQWRRQGRWQPFSTRAYDGSASGGEILFQDRDGAIWLRPIGPGLVRMQGERADRFTQADGLSSDEVRGFLQDAEGTVWVLTARGLDSFSRFAVTTFSSREHMPNGPAAAVAARADGAVIAAADEVVAVKGGDISILPAFKPGEREGGVNAMLMDSSQRLWVSKGNQLFLHRGNAVSLVKSAIGEDRLAYHEIVSGLLEDVNHQIWGLVLAQNHRRRLVIVTPNRLQEVLELPAADVAHVIASDNSGGIWSAGSSARMGYLKDGRLSAQPIPDADAGFKALDMFVDSKNRVWIASNEGMRILSNGNSRSVREANGLPCEALFSAMIDRDETLWISSGCGIMHIGRREWTKILEDPGANLAVELLGPVDGWSPAYVMAAGRLAQTADGKVWFAGPELQMVDPRELRQAAVIPPAHIEEMLVDRRPYASNMPSRLPPNPRQVQIDYTAPSFINPRAIQFKYRLQGHDEGWQDAGTRRQAFYNDLAPGRYRFDVVAGAKDARASAADSLEFTVAPALYQTWWFRAVGAALSALALWMLYMARLNRVTNSLRLRYQDRLAERESIARDLHDTLLQAVQSLVLRFHTAIKQLPRGDARLDLERVLDDSDRVMRQGRELMLELRAPSTDTSALADVMVAAGTDLKKAYPGNFEVSITGAPRPLVPLVFEEVRRIGLEALSNAFRHAGATLIEVEVSYSRNLMKVRIRDDGTGIDPAILAPGFREGHWGLPGMRERAAKAGGRLNIWSAPGAGTEVEVTITARAAYEPHKRHLWFGWLIGSRQ